MKAFFLSFRKHEIQRGGARRRAGQELEAILLFSLLFLKLFCFLPLLKTNEKSNGKLKQTPPKPPHPTTTWRPHQSEAPPSFPSPVQFRRGGEQKVALSSGSCPLFFFHLFYYYYFGSFFALLPPSRLSLAPHAQPLQLLPPQVPNQTKEGNQAKGGLVVRLLPSNASALLGDPFGLGLLPSHLSVRDPGLASIYSPFSLLLLGDQIRTFLPSRGGQFHAQLYALWREAYCKNYLIIRKMPPLCSLVVDLCSLPRFFSLPSQTFEAAA
jgi:hypothetical protein